MSSPPTEMLHSALYRDTTHLSFPENYGLELITVDCTYGYKILVPIRNKMFDYMINPADDISSKEKHVCRKVLITRKLKDPKNVN